MDSGAELHEIWVRMELERKKIIIFKIHVLRLVPHLYISLINKNISTDKDL